MAYNPADFELVEAPAGSASPYNPADFELVEAPQGSGFWRQALDLPVSALGGVVSGLKGMSDVFGANNPVSQELASYQQFYNQSLSPEAQADQQEVARIMQQAQDKGVWEQIKAGGRAFAVAPLDTAAQSLGTMAPVVATGLAGRAFGLGAKGVQIAQAAASSGMQMGTVKDEIYQNTKQFLMQQGKSEEDADKVALEAQSYGGQNLDQLLLAAGLGAADALFGAERILGGAISKTGKEVTGGVIANALKTGVSEAIPEGLQGGQEPLAKNVALQREGYNVPTMRGVVAQGTMEGLAGFAAGAPVGAAEGMAPRMDDRNLPPIQVGPTAQEQAFTPPPAAEPVVVEEVFGDPTTAAAEPVAAEPSFDPSQPFEVVEEPSAPIVTEPAAPSVAPESTQPDTTVESEPAPTIDAPFLEGLASKYGAPVLPSTPSQEPYETMARASNMLERAADRSKEADELQQILDAATGMPFESRIAWAVANNPNSSTETFAQAKKNPAMVSMASDDAIASLDNRRATLQQQLAQQPAPMPVQDAPLRLIKKTNRAPANTSKWPSPKTEGAEVVFSPYGPEGSGFYERQATAPAEQTTSVVRVAELEDAYNKAKKKLDDLGTEPPKPSPERLAFGTSGRAAASPEVVAAYDARVKAYNSYRRKYTAAKKAEVEASNNLFFARQKLEEQQASQHDTPAKRSRRRIKNMTAQSGAIDLSIVEDLVEYGKTVYRAGMSFGKWAGEMVKEFGQGIASFLRQAFDRIVQAYKDSPYSDTTGAVGDVRPKAKPRQFEQKAAKAPGISEEARAQMGNDPYVPITLRGVAEDAKAWIAENGVEAAERRILGLADEGQTPTPLDFSIGLELTANLSATGNAARAASVVRTMSRRATSLGQTISTLAMLSRLTPEGIVFYANQIIEQHIGSLSPERQAEIRAAQQDVANLEETVATTRKRTAEDSIINGTQGGEKIQEKLKRRMPDKAQKQRTNVSIRSVLTSQATKAEATKQITQILVDSGISQSEATALATAITSRFYKVMEDARKALANSRKPANGKGRVTIDKLLAQLKDGKITDEEFVSALAQVRGVPALTAADKARIQNLAEQYKASTDDQISLVLAARLFEEVHSIIPPDFLVKLRALSYLSMLFSPNTWIRNIGGNQIQWIANAGRDAVINMVVDPAMSLLTGRRTSAFGNTKRFRSLFTPIGDVIRGYKWNQQQNPSANFSENMRAGIEHLRVLAKLTTQNKFDIADAKEVGRRIFSNKFMAAWETALSVALGGPDRGFWMSAFTASLSQREAAAKKNGEWTGQPTPEDVEAAYADAMHAIYQNQNVVSQSANRIRAALNRISTFGKTDQFGLGTALLAFTQVPGSITLRGLIEWSPLGMINALYESMRPLLYKATNGKGGGNFRQEQFNKAFTQALLGSGGLFVGGYWLYALGVVTASREDDDDLEAMRRASGMGAYRVNLSALKRLLSPRNFFQKQEQEDNDLIVPYDWAQPLAITFAAGAEFAKEVEQNNREGLKKGMAAKASMAAISLAAGAKSLEEQPLLSGLSSFMKTWGYSGPLDAVVNTIAGVPSMFVPQLVRKANQLMDNTVRETRGDQGVIRAFNQIAANTPGVADKFPPRFDIMGQAIERYQYAGNNVFNVLISPAMTTRIKQVPALREVARLVDTTGDTRQVPRQVRRTATINGQSVDLTNEQISAYQYYLGNYTMSIFSWRMASPAYARLPDVQKVNLLAQDLEDIDAATKSALFGHDIRRLTRRQRVMRNNLVNSPLGQSMPPR